MSEESESASNAQGGETRGGPFFATTSWTAVVQAGRSQSPQATEALAILCQSYWPPLYAYLRRLGYNSNDAKDLVQEFFYVLLSKNYLGAADRRKGKFRSFLLTALKHFLANEWDRSQAKKRGGGQQLVSLDDLRSEEDRPQEPALELSPAKAYEQRWARTVLHQAEARLQREFALADKSELFCQIKDCLEGFTPAGEYPALAARLRMSRGAVRMAVHRMRQRFGELLRAEVAATLVNPSPEEVEAELRHLLESVGS